MPPIVILTPRVGPPPSLRKIIELHAPGLRLKGLMFNAKPVEGQRLLLAIAKVESSLGYWNVPRYEPGYGPGGYYYKKAEHVRDLYNIWGAMAACSWSSWQLMYITAWELGYRATPLDLWHDDDACAWVVEFINRRILARKPQSLAEVADAYNSGSFGDSNRPQRYIRKLIRAYEEVEV